MKNLNEFGVQEMGIREIGYINGGTTCPTYDIQDNYDGLVACTKEAAPIAGEVIKTFAYEIMKFIFL